MNQKPAPPEGQSSEQTASLATSDDAACSGRVEISHREIATTGGCCSGMQSVILSIAAQKGCPVDGIIVPKYHPDYDYRVTHYAEGRMTIEWKIRSQNMLKDSTSAEYDASESKNLHTP